MLVTVRSVHSRRTRNRRAMVEAVVGDGTGRLHVTFFNQPWRERQLSAGVQVALFGKVEIFRGKLQMTNPVVDLIGDRTGRIMPIYPQSEKAQLTTWELAGWVEDGAGAAGPRASPIRCRPRSCDRLGLVDRSDALRGDPRSPSDRGQGAGPAAAGVRRAAPRPARARAAQAGARARGRRHPPRGRRRAGRAASTPRCRSS